MKVVCDRPHAADGLLLMQVGIARLRKHKCVLNEQIR